MAKKSPNQAIGLENSGPLERSRASRGYEWYQIDSKWLALGGLSC